MLKFDRAKFTAFVAERTEDKATREAIFELLEFSMKNALKVVGGASNTNFHYVVGTRNGSAMLFYCDTSGVWMSLGNFPELSTASVSKFLHILGSSPAFDYIRRFEDRRLKGGMQGFSIKETLVDPTIMKNFKMAIIELQRAITEG